MAVGIALGVTVFVTGAAAVDSLAALGPIGPFVALIVGAIAAISELGALIAYIVNTNEYKSERDQAQRELNDLKAQLEVLKDLKATLENQKADITDICARLDRFAAIWGYVKHDAQLIYDGIEAAVGDEGSKKTFKKRVSLIKDSYTKLGAALSLYYQQGQVILIHAVAGLFSHAVVFDAFNICTSIKWKFDGIWIVEGLRQVLLVESL
ncbi:hypothetical protein HYDPIDRAFT_31925 [Hydnomerulius pinastri MD-312]|uniref:Uncharacterized protein n=1 Tax=Hydnomerulius pinastri MD-312 TaxID=994086 RepID=A0A0C9VSJ9_9AGAM|nr:hypothetical protein HYDPIDRAFT_31925 [Hydnomerulius pinastri MD-312]